MSLSKKHKKESNIFDDISFDSKPIEAEYKVKDIDNTLDEDFDPSIDQIEDNWVEEDYDKDRIPDPKDMDGKKIICRECGKSFGSISVPHLRYKHNSMSLCQYIRKHPTAPVNYYGEMYPHPNKVSGGENKGKSSLPDTVEEEYTQGTYYDDEGCLRYVGNGQLVPGSKTPYSLARRNAKKVTEIESYTRSQIGWKGEKLIDFWIHVMTYIWDPKTEPNGPLWTPAQQLKASENLGDRGFGKATNFSKIDKNIKHVKVIVGSRLPKDLNPEDF